MENALTKHNIPGWISLNLTIVAMIAVALLKIKPEGK